MANPMNLAKKAAPVAKKAGPVVIAGVLAVLNQVKDNPEFRQQVAEATDAVRRKLFARAPRPRLEAKLAAVETAVRTLEDEVPEYAPHLAGWRKQAAGIATRLDLLDRGTHGRQRKVALRALLAEADDLLTDMNDRIAGLADFTARPLRDY